MKRSPRNRSTASLSVSTFRQLNSYALAASAAGVGVLALAPVAEGKVIYTPANKTVRLNHAVPIDLNHDGIDDFDVFNLTHNSTTPFGDYVGGEPVRSGNQIIVLKTNRGFDYDAMALAAGVRVGPGKQFRAGRDMMAYRSSGDGTVSGGPWKNVKNRYLGLKFLIKGKTHYGWARLNVAIADQNVNATITGYAYETVPDQAIVTGKTDGASLGRLAQGR